MDITNIKSIPDLINYYGAKDKNSDGKLTAGEISSDKITKYDRSGDKALSPWEIMEAANRIHPTPIFKLKEISRLRRAKRSPFPFFIKLKSDTTIRGIKYKRGPVFISKYGKVLFGVLAANTTIQGRHFMAGTKVFFYLNGDIRGAKSLVDTTFQLAGQKVTIKAGSVIEFYGTVNSRIKSVTLAKPTPLKIAKQFTVATRTFTFKAGTKLILHGNGEIKSGTLASNTIYNTLSKSLALRAGTRLFFLSFSDVNVNYLIPPADMTIKIAHQKYTFKAGTKLFLHPDGSVFKGALAIDTTIRLAKNKIALEAGSKVSFYQLGKIRDILEGTLAADTVFRTANNKLVLKGGTRFSSSFRLFSGYLAKDITLKIANKKIIFKGGTLVSFKITNKKIIFKGGTLVFPVDSSYIRSGYLATDTNFKIGRQIITFTAGTHIQFRKGRVYSGYLAKDSIIDGEKLKAGTLVTFHPDGSLASPLNPNNPQRICNKPPYPKLAPTLKLFPKLNPIYQRLRKPRFPHLLLNLFNITFNPVKGKNLSLQRKLRINPPTSKLFPKLNPIYQVLR